METRLKFLQLLILVTALGPVHPLFAAETDTRPRLLVLTDIGGDPDDQQSLIRLLVHANEFQFEGLVASASGTRGELGKAVTRPDLILEQIQAYEEVYPNLIQHADGFPMPGHLRSIVRSGNPQRGRTAVGDGHATGGSQLIVEAADRGTPLPLNIAIWGGQTDLAQACWDVRRERGESGLREFLSRIRVHDIADQDGIFEWMNREFAFPFYILDSAEPGRDRREAVFRGMYLGGDESLTSRDWIEQHVRTGHGPLGALYPTRTWTAPNPHSTLKEGDTPSWFYFLPHGLNDPARPDMGGWGGRFERRDGIWRDSRDSWNGIEDGRTTVSRWRPFFQNQFQARMDWCVTTFDGANHNPVVTVQGDATLAPLHLTARSGETVRLAADGTKDPDTDHLNYHWWHYREPGTFRGEVTIRQPREVAAAMEAPSVESSQTVHVILAVTDDGNPPLTAHRRIVIEVLPAR